MNPLGFAPALWPRIDARLDELLQLPEADRARWLAALPASDDDLRPVLARMLAGTQTLAADALPADLQRVDGWRPGDVVGPWRLVGLLGEGGMGTVWLARRTDGLVHRPVALKLPRAGNGGRDFATRVARERQLLASLTHPNIARLYDAGTTADGQPWLALEVVTGQRIDVWCRERATDVRTTVALFLQAARAVAHAHARLIVHCDIKPSNLLVDADGQVMLLDFGIARLVDPAATGAGAPVTRIFTPGYAAPEQMAGTAVDVRSDVWSLGVVLHELLVGEAPVATAAADTGVVPARPSAAIVDRARARQVRGDLDTILLRAVKPLPPERYPTVDAFADDLQRYLDGRPVLARPDSAWYVLRKLVARHRIAFAASALALVATLVATGVVFWQARIAELERARADQVKEFVTRLLRDAGPYRLAAADWRSTRLMSRLMRSGIGRGTNDVARTSALELLRNAADEIERTAITQPAVRSELRRVIAEGLASFGDVERAGHLIGTALAEATAALGPAHAEVLRSTLVLVQLDRFGGRHDDVTTRLGTLIPALRAREAADPEPLVTGLQLVALAAMDRADIRSAVVATEEAARVAGRLSPSHPERVATATLQSTVARAAGQPEAALGHALRALDLIGTSPEARADPRRVEALLAAGRAHADTGAHAEALLQLEAAVGEARRLLGEDHPAVGFMLQGMVSHAIELGRLDAADRLSAEALRIVAVHFKPGMFAYESASAARGAFLLATGQPADALALLDPAVIALRRQPGPAHPVTLAHEANRVEALHRLGRVEVAVASARALDEVVRSAAVPPPVRARIGRVVALVTGR